MRIVPPTVKAQSFLCPNCNTHAKQTWHEMQKSPVGGGNIARVSDAFLVGYCSHCSQHTIWCEKELIYPPSSPAPAAHDDLPNDLKGDFEEARMILAKSPRGSAALLRLVIQKLLQHLGESGTKINDDIKSLVAKGLPLQIQQALDVVRVIGNESVHPGQINLNDTPETAQALFGLINLIVDNQIAQPKRVAELYNSLPADKLAAIANRDK